MRLIRLVTNYSTYLDQFYAQRPKLAHQEYSFQYQKLMADCYALYDCFTHTLDKFGYEVWEPVVNAEPMQKIWAQEHGIAYHQEAWLFDILTAQVKQFQPEIVLVYDHHLFDAKLLQYLRQACPSIRLIIAWCASPHSIERFNEYDLILSSIPAYVKSFREQGFPCEYMRHAFGAKVLDAIDRHAPESYDISFIGSIIKAPNYHFRREQFLKNILREIDVQLWLEAKHPTQRELWGLSARQFLYEMVHRTKSIPPCYSLLQKLPKLKNFTRMEYLTEVLNQQIDSSILVRSRPPLFGSAMYQVLHESKLTLNIHGDNSIQFASNMRLYEATGVGTCLLTERQPNLSELFEPDVEVATYQNVEEAVEKVHYLLGHDDERQKIAAAGQRRTLKEHTFAHRAQQLDRIIQQQLRIAKQ